MKFYHVLSPIKKGDKIRIFLFLGHLWLVSIVKETRANEVSLGFFPRGSESFTDAFTKSSFSLQ